MLFKVECWYRYGPDGDETDFFVADIEAASEEEVKDKAKSIRRNIFKTEVV